MCVLQCFMLYDETSDLVEKFDGRNWHYMKDFLKNRFMNTG